MDGNECGLPERVPCCCTSRAVTELTLTRCCPQPELYKGRSHPAGPGCREIPYSHFREMTLTIVLMRKRSLGCSQSRPDRIPNADLDVKLKLECCQEIKLGRPAFSRHVEKSIVRVPWLIPRPSIKERRAYRQAQGRPSNVQAKSDN